MRGARRFAIGSDARGERELEVHTSRRRRLDSHLPRPPRWHRSRPARSAAPKDADAATAPAIRRVHLALEHAATTRAQRDRLPGAERLVCVRRPPPHPGHADARPPLAEPAAADGGAAAEARGVRVRRLHRRRRRRAVVRVGRVRRRPRAVGVQPGEVHGARLAAAAARGGALALPPRAQDGALPAQGLRARPGADGRRRAVGGAQGRRQRRARRLDGLRRVGARVRRRRPRALPRPRRRLLRAGVAPRLAVWRAVRAAPRRPDRVGLVRPQFGAQFFGAQFGALAPDVPPARAASRPGSRRR